MLSTRTCIDVDDLDRGVAFYTGALGLEVVVRNATEERVGLGATLGGEDELGGVESGHG